MNVTAVPAGTVSDAGEKPLSAYVMVEALVVAAVVSGEDVAVVPLVVGAAGALDELESRYHAPPTKTTATITQINAFIEIKSNMDKLFLIISFRSMRSR
jgi:hypothetical protein